MAHKVRWGIIGAGKIARKFAEGLRFAKSAELVAIGSRSRQRAEQFATEFAVPHAHVGYENLASDDEVDAVYIATPHPMHKPNSILCLQAHKAVLCEKPFTVNAPEAEQVIAEARRQQVFIMEAMWTRFVPPIAKLRQLLAQGAVGDVRMVMADFGYRAEWDPQGRALSPALAGGGLLDVGVYGISLASMVLGPPQRVTGLAHIADTGVDEQAAVVLGYDGGALAVLVCAVRTDTPGEATVIGTEGRIQLGRGWWHGSTMTLVRGKEREIFEIPTDGNGFNYEADEVAQCLADGKTQSDVLPLDETLAIMRTMDEIRAQWGLKYPME